jgi:hypothetical protein
VTAALVATAGLGPVAPAHGGELTDLVVSRVHEPDPPTARPGEAIALRARVRARGGEAKRSVLRYYLSKDRRRGRGDLVLGSDRVPALTRGSAAAYGERIRGVVPRRATDGFHYVLACADDERDVAESREANCRATPRRITVLAEEPAPRGEPRSGTPTQFEEVRPTAADVSGGFPCPHSEYGQDEAECVYVRTRPFRLEPSGLSFASFVNFCPGGRPYLFLVGDRREPLWENLGDRLQARAWPALPDRGSIYFSGNTGWPASWAGDPSAQDPEDRNGYAAFALELAADRDSRARFVCADKVAS